MKWLLALSLLSLACRGETRPSDDVRPAVQDEVRTSEAAPLAPEPQPPVKPPKPATAPEPDEETSSPRQSPHQSPHQGPGQFPALPLTIAELAYAGTGCPADTVATNVSPDAKAFTLVFARFALETLPGEEHAAKRCDVSLSLAVPNGWQVTVLTLDLRGFADLPDGAHATLTSSLKPESSRLAGPHAAPFAFRHEAALKTASWSECGKNTTLKVAIDARLSSPKAEPATLSLDSLDGELKHEIGLAWRRCHEP